MNLSQDKLLGPLTHSHLCKYIFGAEAQRNRSYQHLFCNGGFYLVLSVN